MSKYKYLIKNVGMLTISNFATKLIAFFLVPLYTSVLSTSEYGIYDLFNTTISLLIPLLTSDIQEAVLRFSMDDKADHSKIWWVGCRYSIIGSVIVLLMLVLNRMTGAIFVLQQYEKEFFALYVMNSFSGIICYYLRGEGKIADISIAGIISSAVVIFSNIFFLLVMKIGLQGYFLSSILGSATQCAYLVIRAKLWKNIELKTDDSGLRKQMVGYSRPMVANAISWWINNASDRYIVTWLCGIDCNGIYSVSYKIPSIMAVLQGIFGQAWTLSAIKEFDAKDEKGFFINVYNAYNFLLVISCSVLIFMDRPLARLLFSNNFYSAWEYAPFLMISTIFSGMAAFLGGFLSALKKSKLFAKSSVITAVVNTILNIGLVLFFGPIGAAVSTMVAYGLMWAIRLVQVKKYVDLRVNLIRDLIAYLILIVQSALLLFVSIEEIYCWYQLLFTIVLLIIYTKEIKAIQVKFRGVIVRN